MKTLKQSQQTARKALHLYELGQIKDAKKLAKRVSWRTLFLEAMVGSYHDPIGTTDKLKGIDQ